MQYVYIQSNEQLTGCVKEISKAPKLAIDLEFDKNRFRYGFNLCLMQIYDGSSVYLIDPIIEDLDLTPVFPVIENPNIQKVVFSFSEDLRLLHSIGCFPKNIYDLQIAAALLNFPPGSLATLLETVLEISVGKSSQQSNWYARPLSEKQKSYAAEDVLYLLDLYEKIHTQVIKENKEHWIEQENTFFEEENHENLDHNVVLKEKYKDDMTEFEWHIFSRLMHFREDFARESNRPAYHIANRETLQRIAQSPEYLAKWNSISTNHRSTKNEKTLNDLKNELDDAIREAKSMDLSLKKKASNRMSKEEYMKMKALDQKVKYAKQTVFGPIQKRLENDFGEHTKTFILSNRLMKDVVSGNTESLLPYKRELFERYAREDQLDLDQYLN